MMGSSNLVIDVEEAVAVCCLESDVVLVAPALFAQSEAQSRERWVFGRFFATKKRVISRNCFRLEDDAALMMRGYFSPGCAAGPAPVTIGLGGSQHSTAAFDSCSAV